MRRLGLAADLESKSDRVLYIEPFSGISGDMMVAALLDLGCELEELEEKLKLLHLTGYRLSSRKCSRSGIHATKFDVMADECHVHRSFREIRHMIESSGLSQWVKDRSVEAFRRLAEAEGKVHHQAPEDVHFHEVGAVDSIIDIAGSMILLEKFLPLIIAASPVNVGQGTVECRHGIYPVPAPATENLLEGIPVFSNAVTGELTTPTGAALLVTLAEHFGPRPMMKMTACGYGAGSREMPGNANVLRVTLGERIEESASAEEQVAVIEATIDDMSPQLYGYFQERALAAGALDVYTTPVQMKKNRPAMMLTVVCALTEFDSLAKLILQETTTIGIRHTIAQRKTLQRKFLQVETPYGAVTMKVSLLEGVPVNIVPEYEDCRRIAAESTVALKEVQAAAVHAYLERPGKGV